MLEEYLRPALAAETPFERLKKLTDSYLAFAPEQPGYFDERFRFVYSTSVDRMFKGQRTGPTSK